MKKIISMIMIPVFALQLFGCAAKAPVEKTMQSGIAQTADETIVSATVQPASVDDSEYFSKRDFNSDYSLSEAVKITLSTDSVSCDSAAVELDGDMLKIKDEGTYILTGTLNGMLTVESENTDKLQLVLDGVNISSDSAAIYVKQADKVFITLAEGSENTLSNSGSFAAVDENNIDAVVFAKDDITFNGSGSLNISSPAGHGVVSKDSLSITGGNYNINSASNGLCGKDDVCIAGGNFEIVSGNDAVKAEHDNDESRGFVYISGGSFKLSAEGDGISASGFMQLEGGNYEIVSGGGSENGAQRSSEMWGRFMPGGPGDRWAMPPEGRPDGFGPGRPDFPGGRPDFDASESAAADEPGSSMKGLKSEGSLTINRGSFIIDSADDAVHSDSDILLEGGKFEIRSGDDAFHAEDELTVNAGDIEVIDSYEGLEALHIRIFSGEISISADDDGLNAAGGVDNSGFGGRDAMFGGPMSANSDGSIIISGGTLSILAYGDGIDANGCVEMDGGIVNICGPAQGDTATLDYDTSALITGGTFIGTGGTMMAQTFSEAKQGLISLSVGSQSAGTEIIVLDSAGKTVCSHVPELDYAVVIISMPELVPGETYTIRVGELSGEFSA